MSSTLLPGQQRLADCYRLHGSLSGLVQSEQHIRMFNSAGRLGDERRECYQTVSRNNTRGSHSQIKMDCRGFAGFHLPFICK
ncbi:hypothetical protein QQF64_010410 [Cirrhinus molitorella]|uniref:Uncharacterized protein n=1 Tax=Cirrhinus molitorella TaxID=172907 RepID=A0ABR3M817_9TELE